MRSTSPQIGVWQKTTRTSFGATSRIVWWVRSHGRYLPAGAQALPRSGGNFGKSFFLPLFPPFGSRILAGSGERDFLKESGDATCPCLVELAGDASYDDKTLAKQALAKDAGINLVAIYPKDLSTEIGLRKLCSPFRWLR